MFLAQDKLREESLLGTQNNTLQSQLAFIQEILPRLTTRPNGMAGRASFGQGSFLPQNDMLLALCKKVRL
jgi:hypothetical protein